MHLHDHRENNRPIQPPLRDGGDIVWRLYRKKSARLRGVIDAKTEGEMAFMQRSCKFLRLPNRNYSTVTRRQAAAIRNERLGYVESARRIAEGPKVRPSIVKNIHEFWARPK